MKKYPGTERARAATQMLFVILSMATLTYIIINIHRQIPSSAPLRIAAPPLVGDKNINNITYRCQLYNSLGK